MHSEVFKKETGFQFHSKNLGLKTTLYYFKHFITKMLKYKAGLNLKIKFVCVATHALVMSP